MTRRAFAPLIAVVALAFLSTPVPAAASNDSVGSFRVLASPFTVDGVSTRHAAGLRLKLNRRARVTLTIEQTGGAIVRHMATDVQLGNGGHRWSWAGKNDAHAVAPDGDYVAHIVVRNSLGTDERRLSLRKGMPPIYPANPGAVTVLINPGHGGSLTGAFSHGVVEKEVNLDIGLRLRRLLQAGGINVVMTRATDVHIPDPEWDVNGDGVIGPTKPGGDDWDGLAYRLDIGNQARADIHIFNHNNAAGCKCQRGTETFTGMERDWTPEGVALATDVQAGQVAQLETFRSSSYYPIDRGVTAGRYYTVSPYSPSVAPLEPRPALMPTVLTESLYISDPIERELLRRTDVREAIAIGLYLGIRDYFATREYGIRYELISAPTDVGAGASADYRVRITNTGNEISNGWRLALHSVPAAAVYDGSGALGEAMGSAAIPDGLAPGASKTLTVNATAPPAAGAWLVKADVWIGGAERPYLSQRGVVSLQVPLTTEP